MRRTATLLISALFLAAALAVPAYAVPTVTAESGPDGNVRVTVTGTGISGVTRVFNGDGGAGLKKTLFESEFDDQDTGANSLKMTFRDAPPMDGQYIYEAEDSTGPSRRAYVNVTGAGTLSENNPAIEADGTDWAPQRRLAVCFYNGYSDAIDAYSWDNGETWEKSPVHIIHDNGTYEVLVRDASGAEATASYTECRLDPDPPSAAFSQDRGEVTVKASDSVSGIIDMSYTVNGETYPIHFTCKNAYATGTFAIPGDGDYLITVADAAGNEKCLDARFAGVVYVNAETLDKYMVSMSDGDSYYLKLMLPGKYNDILAQNPYSWDGGRTWTSMNTARVYPGNTYRIMLKLKAGEPVKSYAYKIER